MTNQSVELQHQYHKALLTLKCALTCPEVSLIINGVIRETESGRDLILVSSTVQVDYEWHEFIEGHVQYYEDRIEASLFANKALLAEQSFDRRES